MYFSRGIDDDKKDRLIQLAISGSLPFGYYVITVSDREDEILRAYSHFDVNRSGFMNSNPVILGIAKNRISAKYLILNMIEDAVAKMHEADLKDYFLNGAQ